MQTNTNAQVCAGSFSVVKLLIVGNREEFDLGVIEEWIELHSAKVERHFREGFSIIPSLSQVDLVIHLGSSWMLTDERSVRACEVESQLMKNVLAHGTPALCICFGAQLLSLAFGGRVERMARPEIGWTTVRAVGGHGLLERPWMQWHYESFSLPQQAEAIAVNSAGTQAIEIGSCLGLQFHPEVNEEVVSKWLSPQGRFEVEAVGVQIDELLARTKELAGSSRTAFLDLLDARMRFTHSLGRALATHTSAQAGPG